MNAIVDKSKPGKFLYRIQIGRPSAMVRRCLVVVALSCLAVAVLFANAHAQASSPYKTAAEHAGFAAEAKELAQIHLHLHHALNCLEGSKGPDYKKVPENPCTGKGALQTLPKNSPDLIRAEKAIAIARVAVTLHDTKAAHYAAQAVRAILTEDK